MILKSLEYQANYYPALMFWIIVVWNLSRTENYWGIDDCKHRMCPVTFQLHVYIAFVGILS